MMDRAVLIRFEIDNYSTILVHVTRKTSRALAVVNGKYAHDVYIKELITVIVCRDGMIFLLLLESLTSIRVKLKSRESVSGSTSYTWS